jgi:outer membrane lipoprotein carrier protein
MKFQRVSLFLLHLGAILLGCLPLTSFASTTDAENLSQILLQYKTLTSNFTQSSYDNNGALLQETEGTMAMLRPNFFRWETRSPTRQIIVTDPKNIWVYDVDLEQVTIEPLRDMVGQAPASLLTDSTRDLLKQFNVTQKSDGADKIWFTLIPKDDKSLYQKIQLHFTQNMLDKMEIIDNIGQKTSVNFKQLKINVNLPPKTFQEKIPKNVDVIGQAL